MPQGGDRARPQGSRRPGGERPGRLRRDRRAGEVRPADLTGRQAEIFLEQARSCEGRSPLYVDLCRRLADDPRVGSLAPDLRWDSPLRLLGAVHYLALSGLAPGAFESWQRFSGTLDDHANRLAELVAVRPIQTNEVRRSWVLLPCLLEVARRTGARTLDLIELGPAAGLNLVWDRYLYRYEAGSWGPRNAPLELEGEERTPVPGALLGLETTVRNRVGIDVNPVDVTTDEGALLLKSFVWADQADRLRRLDDAIAALRTDPPDLIRGDFVDLLPDLLAKRRPGALTVVFQTGASGYLTPEQRRRLDTSLEEAGERGPLALVATGAPSEPGATHWGLSIQLWPGDGRELVAEADFHGSWLDWAS